MGGARLGTRRYNRRLAGYGYAKAFDRHEHKDSPIPVVVDQVRGVHGAPSLPFGVMATCQGMF